MYIATSPRAHSTWPVLLFWAFDNIGQVTSIARWSGRSGG